MIVYNTNPKGTPPIMIISDWEPGENGKPAICKTTYSIAPKEGIDLSIIGLEPTKTSSSTSLKVQKKSQKA